MKTLLEILVRGFRGHPNHPPLTDATIGAYTAGTLMVFLSWLGLFLPEKLAWGGFLSILAGLLFSIPTIVTGFFDYIQIPRGTGMRRTANLHWISMVLATSTYLVAAALLQKALDHGIVTTAALAVTLSAFALLFVGGYVGGTVVFEYGMRVRNVDPETPMADALKPKAPPD